MAAKVTAPGEISSPDLLTLARRFRPFRSFFVAAAIALGVLFVAERTLRIGPTELIYFMLAPYYGVLIAVNARRFFGSDIRSVAMASTLGVAGACLLYCADIVFGALAQSGHISVAWNPGPLHMVLFATASAVVETVIFQLGIQSRIRGWVGVVAAALLFAAFHISPKPIFVVAGVVLALLQRVTGRPGGTLVAHAAYNALISAVPPL